jgi:hypothetical protein
MTYKRGGCNVYDDGRSYSMGALSTNSEVEISFVGNRLSIAIV